jgi:zinc transporter ZupT
MPLHSPAGLKTDRLWVRARLPAPVQVLDFFLGVSGGVMTAASYWSLLAPALDFAEQQGYARRPPAA